MVIVAVVLLSIGFGTGTAAIVHTLTAPADARRDRAVDAAAGRLVSSRVESASVTPDRRTRRSGLITARHHGGALLGIVATVIAFLVTTWPATLLLGGAAALGVPILLGRLASSTASDRIEAVATWTELLEGTMAASAGLVQALVATAPLAPDAIRPAATHLAARLDAGESLRSALLEFARDVDDPAADRVICALIMASGSRAQKLGDLLSALAAATRDDVSMRLRIEASRASVVSGARTVVIFSVAFAAALVVLARSYLAPFGDAAGQAILIIVGLLYACGLVLMVSIAAPNKGVRLLQTPTEALG
jgi:Flp pilus assembly protein TadB